jgi:large subunit ribosomal protein L5
MATKEKEKKKGGKGGDKGDAPKVAHAGASLPVPPPRTKLFYQTQVKATLMSQLGLKNPHQVPTLEKIVVNVGVGEAIKQPKVLDKVVDELGIITGQRAVRKRAKKSISNFGLRQGQEIGACVTLRGARMWEFFDRFVSVAVPRIRDFRGLSTRSFDGRGNYSLGVKEQMIFPEINYDMVDMIHGMDITFVTSANRDDQAFALLRALGMPFRTEDKKGGREGGREGGRSVGEKAEGGKSVGEKAEGGKSVGEKAQEAKSLGEKAQEAKSLGEKA